MRPLKQIFSILLFTASLILPAQANDIVNGVYTMASRYNACAPSFNDDYRYRPMRKMMMVGSGGHVFGEGYRGANSRPKCFWAWGFGSWEEVYKTVRFKCLKEFPDCAVFADGNSLTNDFLAVLRRARRQGSR